LELALEGCKHTGLSLHDFLYRALKAQVERNRIAARLFNEMMDEAERDPTAMRRGFEQMAQVTRDWEPSAAEVRELIE